MQQWQWLDQQQQRITCQERASRLCAVMTTASTVLAVCVAVFAVADAARMRHLYVDHDALFAARCEARCWRAAHNKSSVSLHAPLSWRTPSTGFFFKRNEQKLKNGYCKHRSCYVVEKS